MKAMVLAAGLGQRMRPLSDLRAKPALPVLNRPLLHHTLGLLARHGVREVVINTHHLPETIEGAVGSGRRFGLRVRYSFESLLLGSGGGPRRVRAFFGEEPALLVNGDCLFDFDLGRLLRRHRESGARATLALKPNPDSSRYGRVVTGKDGFIRSIRGLPRPGRGQVALFTGLQVLDPALLERLPPGRSDIVADLYAPLLAEGAPLLGLRMAGAWHDLGSPRSYLEEQLRALGRLRGRTRAGALVDPAARVSRGSRVVRSVVGARALVSSEAVVSRSILWPDAFVGAGAQVRAASSPAAQGRARRASARPDRGRGREGAVAVKGGGGRVPRFPLSRSPRG